MSRSSAPTQTPISAGCWIKDFRSYQAAAGGHPAVRAPGRAISAWNVRRQVEVELNDGQGRKALVPLVGVTNSYVGLTANMSREALDRLSGQGNQISARG
jgi:hypothetical protein